MSKEGSKYVFLLVTLVMIISGVLIVNPFPWTRAGEREISGQITANDTVYDMSGGNVLLITDLREVQGRAVAADDVIYFNENGAEVKIDQLGYWYGQAYSDKMGWIKFSVADEKVVLLKDGQLSGVAVADDGTVVQFAGESDWEEFELAEIQVDNELLLAVNNKKLIDAEVLGLGGRDLYDVQKKWIIKDPSLSVDEYGYVTATKKGVFENAIVLQVGDQEKAITLQVIPTNQIDKYEPRVVTTDRGDVTINVDFEAEVEAVENFRLVKGAGEFIQCSHSLSGDNKRVSAVCNFGTEDVGFWNIAITFNGREQVYTDSINVLGTENTLNVTGDSVVTFKDAAGGDQTSPDRSVFTDNIITYNMTVNFPSFVVGNAYGIDDIDFSYTVKGRGRTDVCREASPPEWCTGLGAYAPDNKNYCGPDVTVSEAPGKIDLTGGTYRSDFESALDGPDATANFNKVLVLSYDDDRPQGCDLVVEMTLTIELDNNIKLQGTAEVINPIRKQKQVYLQSDLLVESGGIKIRQIDPNNSLYTLTAGENVEIGQLETDNQLKGIVEEYKTNKDALFDMVVDEILGRVNKLVAERGKEAPNPASLATSNSPISIFSADDKALMPEGRIWYYSQGSGEVVLGDTSGSSITVCAPTTMVVEGRDVVIMNNIEHAVADPGPASNCVDNGKFGLIVMNGDIYFDGSVENVEGFFFTTGTLYTGISANPFRMEGVAIAHDFVLQRY